MKKIIPFLALAVLFACKSKAEKTLTLDTPTDKTVYTYGETIHFAGDLKTSSITHDEAILRVYNKNTGAKVMEETFNTDYDYTLINVFSDTTILEVQLSLQKDDKDTEDLKKTVSITCLPE